MVDLIGQRFGRLTVQGHAPALPGKPRHKLVCLCDCGQICHVAAHPLLSGVQVSCGCNRRERARENIKKARATGSGKGNLRHGLSGTAECSIWRDMKRRCLDPRRPAWDSYGGRGITVCDRWLEKFENFYEDMGPRPTALHTLDRVDNDGPYSPENCKWATRKVQARNRRSSAKYTALGRTLTIAEWAELLHVKVSALGEQLRRCRSNGNDPETVLARP